MAEILDSISSNGFSLFEIEAGKTDIIEISDPGVSGPSGESGIIPVFFGTGNPPAPISLKEGSIYVVKH